MVLRDDDGRKPLRDDDGGSSLRFSFVKFFILYF